MVRVYSYAINFERVPSRVTSSSRIISCSTVILPPIARYELRRRWRTKSTASSEEGHPRGGIKKEKKIKNTIFFSDFRRHATLFRPCPRLSKRKTDFTDLKSTWVNSICMYYVYIDGRRVVTSPSSPFPPCTAFPRDFCRASFLLFVRHELSTIWFSPHDSFTSIRSAMSQVCEFLHVHVAATAMQSIHHDRREMLLMIQFFNCSLFKLPSAARCARCESRLATRLRVVQLPSSVKSFLFFLYFTSRLIVQGRQNCVKLLSRNLFALRRPSRGI